MMRRVLKACILVVAALVSTSGLGQGSFPDRPIRLVVPQSAGSSTDAVARLLAEKMAVELKQPIIVDNQPAAGGIVAMAKMAKEKADGYTVMFCATGQVVWSPILRSNLGYDPLKDFTFIAPVAEVPFVVVASTNSEITDMASLIAKARSAPGEITFSSAGSGTGSHILMEMIAQATGTRLMHVPYKGTAPAFNSVISGETSLHPVGVGLAVGSIQSGRVVPIAMASAQRSPVAPNVPTLKETLGPAIPDFPAWVGFIGPAGLPNAVVQRLGKALETAMESREVQQRFAALGFTVAHGDADAFLKRTRNEIEVWGKLIRERGIREE